MKHLMVAMALFLLVLLMITSVMVAGNVKQSEQLTLRTRQVNDLKSSLARSEEHNQQLNRQLDEEKAASKTLRTESTLLRQRWNELAVVLCPQPTQGTAAALPPRLAGESLLQTGALQAFLQRSLPVKAISEQQEAKPLDTLPEAAPDKIAAAIQKVCEQVRQAAADAPTVADINTDTDANIVLPTLRAAETAKPSMVTVTATASTITPNATRPTPVATPAATPAITPTVTSTAKAAPTVSPEPTPTLVPKATKAQTTIPATRVTPPAALPTSKASSTHSSQPAATPSASARPAASASPAARSTPTRPAAVPATLAPTNAPSKEVPVNTGTAQTPSQPSPTLPRPRLHSAWLQQLLLHMRQGVEAVEQWLYRYMRMK